MSDTTGSPFARALQDLFDGTNFFSREEWSLFLGVKVSILSDWIADKALPGADRLRVMLDALRTYEGVVQEPLVRFDALLQQPATAISPFGAFMAPTVAEYLKRFSLTELGVAVRRLSPDQARRVLAGSWDADSIDTYMYFTAHHA